MLLVFVWVAYSHTHPPQQWDCDFDSIKLPPFPKNWSAPQIEEANNHARAGRRILVTRNYIRITHNKSPLQSYLASFVPLFNFFSNTVDAAAAFYTLRLKVYSLTSNINMGTYGCSSIYTIPVADSGNGIANSDLHIYVIGSNSSASSGAVASGIPCVFLGGTLPDVTVSTGRPVAGVLNINVNSLSSTTTFSPALYGTTIATMIHQHLHILGFGSSYIPSWLNSGTQNVHTTPTTTSTVSRGSSITITLLTTPNVLAWAKAHYGCNSLLGMQLQNQGGGGTAGSHWQRLVAYDQIMTGSRLGVAKSFTGASYAALKDMGWYDVEDIFQDNQPYGFNMGCDFFNSGCYFSSFPQQYCSVANQYVCGSTGLGKAVCGNSATLSDSCKIGVQAISCIDSEQSTADGIQAYTQETYGTSSGCFTSSASMVAVANYNIRCYKYNCSADNTRIFIIINSVTYTCNAQGNTFTVEGQSGSVTCPNPVTYCAKRRIMCPNFCSGNGFCTGGICNCKPGFFGKDCSISSCLSSQFYYQQTGTCTGSCPSGFYNNKYNRNCQACVGCNQCSGSPTTCTACPGGIQVLYGSTCVNSCPNLYFNNSGVCTSCHNSCTTCNAVGSSFCTSCSTLNSCSSYLWDSSTPSPTTGSCVATCTGVNNYADTSNCRCLQSSCPYNQYSMTNGSTNFICQLCASGQFFDTAGNCCIGAAGCGVASCAAGTFARTSDRFCASCYTTTCLTCNDIFSTNCTTCKPATPYLYLGSCVIAPACGYGTFPDTSGNPYTCTSCPNSCTSCTSSVACLSCAGPSVSTPSGFFLTYASGSTTFGSCGTSCTTSQYIDSVARVCKQCDSSCFTCSSSEKTGCVTCTGSAYFYTNSSGSYCLQLCPSVGTYPDPSNICVTCHSSCYTCSGSTSSNCFSCTGNLYLNSGMCTYFCPQKTYRNNATNICATCDTTCNFCFAAGAAGCLSCKSGLYLNDTTCISACPNNTKPNAYGVCFGNLAHGFAFIVLAALIQ